MTNTTRKTAKKGFTDEERAVMRGRAQELKAAANKEEGEKAVLAAIAAMPEPDRASPHAENLVRDACICQGRQCRLLLPKRSEVQDEIRDVRL